MTEDIYKKVTIEQFKEYFFRDFPFLPVWIEGKVYFIGDVVYYGQNFYKSLTDNNTALPTDAETGASGSEATDQNNENPINIGVEGKKWQAIAGNVNDYITDADIIRAMSQAYVNANYRFGGTDDERVMIYLHLIAFYLVIDWQNAAMGVNSGYAGLVASKSVGDVSESYNFPQWMMNNPLYSLYSSNGYGMKYLSLIIPYLSVTILFSPGRTTYG